MSDAPTPPPVPPLPPTTPPSTPPAPPAAPPSSGPGAAGPNAMLGSADPLDLATIALGVLAFVGSLLPFYSVSLLGASEHTNGWHDLAGSGFWGWFGCVVGLIAAVVAALPLLGRTLPMPQLYVLLGLFGVALVLFVIAVFDNPLTNVKASDACDGDTSGLCRSFAKSASIGHGWGFWFAVVMVLLALALNGYRLLMGLRQRVGSAAPGF
jgi:hypothetical protein